MVPENIYCGYCSRLIDASVDDNNILICINCEGQFHMECTSLSGSPKEQHHLKWRCNNCVKNEPLVRDDDDDETETETDPIEFNCDDLCEQVERRLTVLHEHFAPHTMQIVYARITSIQYERKDKEECLIINSVPRCESEKLIELVMKMGTPLGIRLQPQQVFRCIVPDDASRPNCSFVIKFDSPTQRKFLLNNYLHSIMQQPMQPAQHTNGTNMTMQMQFSKPQWTLGDDCEQGNNGGSGGGGNGADTKLLPQTTTVASSITTSPLYMYEFLSAQRQTMLVKSITAENVENNHPNGDAKFLANDCIVVHNDSTHIIPVIKISSAPMIRLASKETFDDLEGK